MSEEVPEVIEPEASKEPEASEVPEASKEPVVPEASEEVSGVPRVMASMSEPSSC